MGIMSDELPIVYNGVDYSASAYIMKLFYALENGRDPGTGIYLFANYAKNLVGEKLPQQLLDYNIGVQNNLIGGYPTTDVDTVPLAIFTAVFGVLMLIHLVIFGINLAKGHYFYLSLAWAGCAAMRVVGYCLRITWSQDITKVNMGIADEVFLVLASIGIVAANLILAQRLFTWRHPVGGSRRLFRYTMLALYAIVAGVIAMTVVASAVPYLYYLSTKVFWNYKICVMVSAILIILYSLTAISLLGLSYFFKPTRKDENLYTYQPWWIESFHPFYFVKKGAAREAEETFMKRNHNHRHAVRVIAATHHHYNMVEGLTNQRGDLSHNKSIILITISTLFIFIGAVVRCVVVFQANMEFRSGPAGNKTLMYIVWGLFEVIIHCLYIVGRVDLRFYKPDVLPRKVRAIITAEQSINRTPQPQSDLEYSDEDDEYYSDEESLDFAESEHKPEDHLDNLDHNDRSDNSPPHYSSEAVDKNHRGYPLRKLEESVGSEFHF